MTKIRVTGPITDVLGPHPKPMLKVFEGYTFDADGQAVAMLRSAHPNIPRVPNTYEVALADALEVLALGGSTSYHDAAILYWGDTVRPYLIHIPYDSADLIVERE